MLLYCYVAYYSSGGVSDEQFASCYRALLEGLKARGTIAVCLAPYDINPKIQYRVTEFEAKRSIIHDLAVEYNVPFIDMKPYMTQALADGASKMELFGDLTHPWAAGCRIISELVVDKISLLIDKDYSTPADLGKYRPLTGTADNADDLTNLRAFLATSQGELSYDTAVYYTKDGFTSAKSLKAAIVNPDPVQTGENAEQANSYIRVLFDYSLSAKRNLTSGTLKFDVKLENAEQWVMLQSYSDLTRHNSSCSAFYTVQLSDGTQATALGDGWYEITVDLANWAAQDNSAALTDSVALIVTASKGMTAQARTNAGIDGKLPTVMWIDNLVIECETIPLNRQEFVSGNSLTILAPEERAYTSVSFDYIITDGEYFQIVLLDNAWKCGYGYFKFNADGAAESYANVTCTKKADGYYHVTITIAEGTKVFSAAPEAIGLLYLRGSWSNAGGYIQNLLFLS